MPVWSLPMNDPQDTPVFPRVLAYAAPGEANLTQQTNVAPIRRTPLAPAGSVSARRFPNVVGTNNINLDTLMAQNASAPIGSNRFKKEIKKAIKTETKKVINQVRECVATMFETKMKKSLDALKSNIEENFNTLDIKMEENVNTLESKMKENSNQNAEVMGEIKAAVCLGPPTLSNASSFNLADLFDDVCGAASSPAPSLPSLGGSPSLPFLGGYLSLPSMGGCPSPPTASSPPTA